MCWCFLPVFQHLCLALTYVKQFFLVRLENHVNQTMNQRWAQLAMIFGKLGLSCIFDGLVVFKLARAQKNTINVYKNNKNKKNSCYNFLVLGRDRFQFF